jgi:type II secretion system protein C
MLDHASVRGNAPNPIDELPEVRSRTAYNEIITSGLFGAAGRAKTGDEPVEVAPPPPQDTEAETTLSLKLKGTLYTAPKDPRSSAVIEVTDRGNKTKTYFISQEVLDRVFLVEVRKNAVILDNRRSGQLEKLTLDPKSTLETLQATQTPTNRVSIQRPTVARPRTSPNTVMLNRDEIVKKLNDSWAQLSSTINIKVVKDDQGNVQGLTTDNISSIDVAKDLGFKDGDVLVSVNNEKVDSADKVAEILNKYRNAKTFRIGISRGGELKYIVYRLR